MTIIERRLARRRRREVAKKRVLLKYRQQQPVFQSQLDTKAASSHHSRSLQVGLHSAVARNKANIFSRNNRRKMTEAPCKKLSTGVLELIRHKYAFVVEEKQKRQQQQSEIRNTQRSSNNSFVTPHITVAEFVEAILSCNDIITMHADEMHHALTIKAASTTNPTGNNAFTLNSRPQKGTSLLSSALQLIQNIGSSNCMGNIDRKQRNEIEKSVTIEKYKFMNTMQKLCKPSRRGQSIVGSWNEVCMALSEVVEIPVLPTIQPPQQHGLLPQQNDVAVSQREPASEFDAILAEHDAKQKLGLRQSQHMWQELHVRNTVDKKYNALTPVLLELEELQMSRQAKEDAIQQEFETKLLAKEQRAEDERLERERVEKEKLLEEELKIAAAHAEQLMQPLASDELERIAYEMNNGNEEDIVAKEGAEECIRRNLRTLLPGDWVNDEVIHFFLIMLAKRDEMLCNAMPGKKRCHFFKSFFITKLLNEGSLTSEGQYEYRSVKRWSKKVPGKDLFQLSKIFFPINQSNTHWTAAMIYMDERRIQYYDSMGGNGQRYVDALFQYIQDEHMDKKKKPLPHMDQWTLVTNTTPDTPRQHNGVDCGVFACMFADFLSKDCALAFRQSHITQCRNRIALSILQGTALD